MCTMNHDPEQLAAAYLAAMRPRARRRFETHLLACEPCWQEVSLARRGRELAESARQVAPPGLRDDIRAAVADTAARQPAARPYVRRPAAVAAAAVILALASAAALARPWPHPATGPAPAPPAALAAAVASYRTNQLPGTSVPVGQAPDLTRLNLHLVAGAAGRLDGVPVTMFVYRAPSGARLTLYRSDRPFAEAAQARELGGAETAAWTAQSSGVTVLCARGNHAELLLGSDPALVRRAAVLLNAI
jgi:hypothetical protein